MRNPKFQEQFAEWLDRNNLRRSNAYPCAHSVRAVRPNLSSAYHRDLCVPLQRSLLANAVLLYERDDTSKRIIVAFPYAPRPGEFGAETHQNNALHYAKLLEVQLFPARRIAMQRLYSTDTTCDIYGPLKVNLNYPDAFLLPWHPDTAYGQGGTRP